MGTNIEYQLPKLDGGLILVQQQNKVKY